MVKGLNGFNIFLDFIYYSLFDLFNVEHITPFEDRWKDVIEVTNEIWKYKDIILSIDKVNEIQTSKNRNVKFKQWKKLKKIEE